MLAKTYHVCWPWAFQHWHEVFTLWVFMSAMQAAGVAAVAAAGGAAVGAVEASSHPTSRRSWTCRWAAGSVGVI